MIKPVHIQDSSVIDRCVLGLEVCKCVCYLLLSCNRQVCVSNVCLLSENVSYRHVLYTVMC